MADRVQVAAVFTALPFPAGARKHPPVPPRDLAELRDGRPYRRGPAMLPADPVHPVDTLPCA